QPRRPFAVFARFRPGWREGGEFRVTTDRSGGQTSGRSGILADIVAQQDDKGGKPPSSPGRHPINLPGGPITEDEIPRDPADLFDAIIVDERTTALGVASRPGAIPPMPTIPPIE